jgi:hypothetical protein
MEDLQGQLPDFQKTSLLDFRKHAATKALTCLHHIEFEKVKSQNIRICPLNRMQSWNFTFLTFPSLLSFLLLICSGITI